MPRVFGSFWLLLHFILVLCCCNMVTFGLPLARQERGSLNDIVLGEDFVAILLESPAQEDLVQIGAISTEPSIQEVHPSPKQHLGHIRQVRSTLYTNYYPSLPSSTSSSQKEGTTLELSTIKTDDNVVVMTASISTTTEDSTTNSESTIKTNGVLSTPNTAVIQAEFRPSIVAESSKSDFSVEESEPLTQEKEMISEDDSEYPARVQAVPSPQALPLLGSNSNLYQGLEHEDEKEGLSPYHHQTLIYHDNPRDPEKSKSVSYSSVVHTLPQDSSSPSQWQNHDETKDTAEHGRQERHYDSNPNFGNSYYMESNSKNVQLPSKENHNEEGSFTYTNPPLKNTPIEWKSQQVQQNVETSTVASSQWTSTKSYRIQADKQPASQHHQRTYGEPEKNYEIEETVSVLSNGRVHGIQPHPSSKPTPISTEVTTPSSSSTKQNDNQKVGYVVEGRNYRKYRVEERTADGFIVGEYGVVSHNDGSLRGVRYTADGTINPRLIYDALMKFLSL